MSDIKIDILPKKQEFIAIKGSRDLHKEAICIFAATGFFMDGDTYWKDKGCLLPAHTHHIDADGFLKKSTPWFEWHYNPRTLSFEHALEEYIALLTTIMKTQVGTSPVVLPLSGGLDSRSQAMVLKDFDNPVHAYSYSFTHGYPEHRIAQQIAKVCGFSFEAFQIPKGYLWDCIDDLAQINQCYSEFTHARQMAILPNLQQMHGVLSLGHWGDVLFDRGAPDNAKEADLVPLLLKKMLKPSGLEFATALWKAWGLEGHFKDYLVGRIETALSKIKIDHVGAKLRAFKTTQWAHRWTTTNLSVFQAALPVTLPYYDDRMCQFICTIPEAYLADRRLQIAHLKQSKALSDITWQAQRPFSIQTFQYNKAPYNLPYRIISKVQRECSALVGKPFIQRNYELQFLGPKNDQYLRSRIFSKALSDIVPNSIISDIYEKFKTKDEVYYSHSMSMLLTLTLWNQHFNLGKS